MTNLSQDFGELAGSKVLRTFITRGVSLVCALVIWSVSVYATPSTIDTSTSSQATTSSSSQRKVFYDTLNEIHWAFYYNGSAIEYSYSADGESWTSAGTLAYDTSSFSAVYKTIGGTSYIFLVAEANTYDVVFRRGTLNASSVNFDAEQTVYDGASISDHFHIPTIALNDSNQIWVSTQHGTNGYLTVVRRSTNIATGDLSLWQAQTSIGPVSNDLTSSVIVSKGGDEMYLLVSTGTTQVSGYLFDGTNWTEQSTGGDYSWFSFDFSQLLSATTIALVGTEIYVGGSFQRMGRNENASYIARFDGTSWKDVGGGLNGTVRVLYLDGDDLWVGGAFTDAGGTGSDHVARWNVSGQTWNPLGAGVNGDVWSFLRVGNDLYLGGAFTNAGGTGSDRIALWDTVNSQWEALGTGLNNLVFSMVSHGDYIFVGGGFTDAGGTGSNRIAKWNTVLAQWEAIGIGIGGSFVNRVSSMAVSGNYIFVGGRFNNVGDANGDGIVRLDATNDTWTSLGTGAYGVNSVAVVGTDVYVAGSFSNAGGNGAADYIARWNTLNSTWNAFAGGSVNQEVTQMLVSGTDFYFAGTFSNVNGDSNIDNVAKWDGANWSGFAGEPTLNNSISAMIEYGGELYIGGSFTNVGGIAAADYIASYDGFSWSALGSGLNGQVSYLVSVGDRIYVIGSFTSAGGNGCNGIAYWDTVNELWGVVPDALPGQVNSVVAFGTDIYFGGDFANGHGTGSENIVRLNTLNHTWEGLGAGISDGDAGTVESMAVLGDYVYVGGTFDANGNYISRWDAVNDVWENLPVGLNNQVYYLYSSGTDLYVAGTFTDADGIAEADMIARWDGSNWHALGTGLTSLGPFIPVYSIISYNNDLYVSGYFGVNGDTGEYSLYRWDGTAWYRVEGVGDNIVRNHAVLDGDLYHSGNLANQETYLSVFKEAVVADADSSVELSATSDPSGNIYLTYTDDSDYLKFRRYDESDSEWASVVTLNASASSSPSIAYKESDGRVTAAWVEANSVNYRHALAPYLGADWKAESVLYGSGTNANVLLSQRQGSDNLPIYWSNGNSNPYAIFVDLLDMSSVPTVILTSTESGATNVSPIPVTIQFSREVTGFVVGDIVINNGSASNFQAVDGDTYTVDITPTEEGVVTVNVAGAVAKDEFENNNVAASQFSVSYDSIAPTVTLSTTTSNPTTTAAIPIIVQFSEAVTGFTIGDVAVTNATTSSFVAVDSDTYTLTVTALADGDVTVIIPAASAVDVATNGNTVSNIVVLRYRDASIDSDGDGVGDYQEELDGTNSLDSGSFLAVLPTSWCSEWNGFFGMYNVNEYTNRAVSERDVVTTLYAYDGVPNSATGLSLSSGHQLDLLIHGMQGWQENSYGKICTEVTNGEDGDVDGRTVYYKLNDSGYDFAFALPYYDGLKGSQFVTFNNIQPSQRLEDQENLVSNWVEISNLSVNEQRGSLIFYDQNGQALVSEVITLGGNSRQDFASHRFNREYVGLVEWRPESSSAKFVLKNTRYYYDNAEMRDSFVGATQLQGMRGNGEVLSAVLDTGGQYVVLEVANTKTTPIDVELKFYNSEGELLATRELENLPGYGSRHLIVNTVVNNELTLATVDGSALGSVVAVAMHYGKSSEATNFGITYSYASLVQEALGASVRGSYNTYLGQGCELQLVNRSSSAVTSTVNLTRLDGSQVLTGEEVVTPPNGASVVDVCGQEEENRYGTVQVVYSAKNTILSQLIRKGPLDDYRFVVPVR